MKRLFTCFITFAAAWLLAVPALAQYPNRPIRIVVPFAAGSATDVISRILGNSVSAAVGQPIVVDNKAGADGAIAAVEVAKAAPDGYTLLMATNSPMSVTPAMKKSLPYDPVADFTPITDIGRYTFFVVSHPGLPANTLPELIQYAKANPGKINYATGNTTGIVSTALLSSLAKIEMVHVPYRSEPLIMADLVSGRVQLLFASATTSMPLIRDGKLRALVTTLPKRSHLLPDVPTIAEAGFPSFSIISWAGLFGPAKLPGDLVARLNKEFVAAMGRPDVQAAMEKQAFVLTPSSPEKLAEYVKEQLVSYRSILQSLGMQPE
jgi:tripartite-type tricarboxylate transporter receptor subunit TctC